MCVSVTIFSQHTSGVNSDSLPLLGRGPPLTHHSQLLCYTLQAHCYCHLTTLYFIEKNNLSQELFASWFL